MTDASTDVAAALVRCEAVAFSTDPLFTYVSGIQSPVYTDNRRMLGFVKERKMIVSALVALARSKFAGVEFGAVAGTATAGIAWAAWLAEEMDLPMMYVRAEAKGHGKGKACEGFAPEGSKVLLVEDLFTTGGSAKTSIENLRNEGYECNWCVGITTYSKPQVAHTFDELGVEAVTLTSVDETLKQARAQSLLTDDQVSIVENWIAEQRV